MRSVCLLLICLAAVAAFKFTPDSTTVKVGDKLTISYQYEAADTGKHYRLVVRTAGASDQDILDKTISDVNFLLASFQACVVGQTCSVVIPSLAVNPCANNGVTLVAVDDENKDIIQAAITVEAYVPVISVYAPASDTKFVGVKVAVPASHSSFDEVTVMDQSNAVIGRATAGHVGQAEFLVSVPVSLAGVTSITVSYAVHGGSCAVTKSAATTVNTSPSSKAAPTIEAIKTPISKDNTNIAIPITIHSACPNVLGSSLNVQAVGDKLPGASVSVNPAWLVNPAQKIEFINSADDTYTATINIDGSKLPSGPLDLCADYADGCGRVTHSCTDVQMKGKACNYWGDPHLELSLNGQTSTEHVQLRGEFYLVHTAELDVQVRQEPCNGQIDTPSMITCVTMISVRNGKHNMVLARTKSGNNQAYTVLSSYDGAEAKQYVPADVPAEGLLLLNNNPQFGVLKNANNKLTLNLAGKMSSVIDMWGEYFNINLQLNPQFMNLAEFVSGLCGDFGNDIKTSQLDPATGAKFAFTSGTQYKAAAVAQRVILQKSIPSMAAFATKLSALGVKSFAAVNPTVEQLAKQAMTANFMATPKFASVDSAKAGAMQCSALSFEHEKWKSCMKDMEAFENKPEVMKEQLKAIADNFVADEKFETQFPSAISDAKCADVDFCNFAGACQMVNGAATCKCVPGYGGAKCESAAVDTETACNGCTKGGICVQGKCSCFKGRQGAFCEDDGMSSWDESALANAAIQPHIAFVALLFALFIALF